jgi:hypothetical protein
MIRLPPVRFFRFGGIARGPAIMLTMFILAAAFTAWASPVSAAIAPMHSADAGLVAVPKDPEWAKYVLLAVIWTLVIAAVIGPMYRFLHRKSVSSDMIKYRGW